MKRTEDSFKLHLQKVAECSLHFVYLVRESLLGDLHYFLLSRCKSDYCSICRKYNLLSLRKLLYRNLSGERWRLVTLTFPQKNSTPLILIRALSKTFDKFMKRIRRKYPDLKFCRSVELHQSDFPHIHLIVNKFIPVSFLQFHWHEVGGGIVDIRMNSSCAEHNLKRCKICYPFGPVPSYKSAARYLTEEFEKVVQDPHRLGLTWWLSGKRCFATSKNLLKPEKKYDWEYKGRFRDMKEIFNYYYLKLSHLPMSDLNSGVVIGPGFQQDFAPPDNYIL